FQAEDGIRDFHVTGVQTCALPISISLFADHPVNKRRLAAGKPPATNVWLWGIGKAPKLAPFTEAYGPRGAMITAVDLLRGLASRSEEHTSELQSRENLVCRLLLEK